MPDEEAKNAEGSEERPNLRNFILLACTLLAVAIPALAELTTVPVWAMLLMATAIVLAAAMLVTGITKTKWFYISISWTLTAALFASDIYLAIPPKRPSAHPALTSAAKLTRPPKVKFVLTAPATVPWCNYFDLTTAGAVPDGYKILVFDASTDANYNVTARYSYDAVAEPVPRVPGEWRAGPVFVSSQYVQNGHGKNVIKDGKLVSNAGYRVAIFAEVLPISVMQVLDEVGSAAFDLPQLPPGPLASATPLDVIRNGDVRPCAKPGA